MNKIKIVIVEDHKIVQDGLAMLLKQNPKFLIIGQVATAYELFDFIKNNIPDLILMDISLPKMSGIEATKIIKKDFPQIKILMLSMYCSQDFILNSIKAGANGYISKTVSRQELFQAINSVMNGELFFGKNVQNSIIQNFVNAANNQLFPNSDQLDLLSPREKQILKLVAEGLTNQQIADQLSISIRTVETHKTNILKKLNLKNTVELVKFAIKNNIIKL
jgi:DNA-binding NarL/FixJ family response regulator